MTAVDDHCMLKEQPGIYVTGELLDTDGICGGYNLQWAWSSGFIAGKAAAM
jgi:predicted flavoprotein YhiN